MNLQIQLAEGEQFTNTDILEVEVQSPISGLNSVLYSIEHISGPRVTHGGSGEAGMFLSYSIDGGTNARMGVVQGSQGTSVIKVVARATSDTDTSATEAANTDYAIRERLSAENNWDTLTTEEQQAYKDTAAIEGVTFQSLVPAEASFTELPPVLPYTTIKSNEVTIVWGDDSFV